ncbi:YbjN domain-containing protein [Aureibacter tunicatorum]|uniref:Molecular chaperone Tir n=1 Tax=Aureibacter tunicatorum TaxID=866807 RepID=A0AAE3XMH5_9BACT|nr:YbjN domain-containing protein [Aureibacter tunicatorum]MDR6238649.1 hypothetical protein [Aureibacter tunicatorum]BDD05420.1 hypothetical protein AUTU_29030 [Aureibacter tunicatorum]
MENHFQKVKNYLNELGYIINFESEEDDVFIIEHESNGVKNMMIGVADPILIFEQFIFELPEDNAEIWKKLLQKNRDIIHGAFVLDDSGRKAIFRDTLQIENLDLNEIEATLNSLGLLLSEYSDDLILFSKGKY